jgi:hypothetical protein
MADEQKAAVYVSWITFKNAIESLAQGIPNQIDRSTFPGLSGGVQSQLFAALKFLGLTTDEDKPTSELHALAVTDEGKRKEKLKEIIQSRYASIIALDLMKATPQQVINTLGEEYGVSGDTREKALRFLLSAVQYVGIPLSRFFKLPGATTSGNGGTRPKRKTTNRTKIQQQNTEEEDDDNTPPPSGTSRVVELKSGGTLTLAASLDLFQLSPADRTFIFGLIDKLDAYVKEGAAEQDIK